MQDLQVQGSEHMRVRVWGLLTGYRWVRAWVTATVRPMDGALGGDGERDVRRPRLLRHHHPHLRPVLPLPRCLMGYSRRTRESPPSWSQLTPTTFKVLPVTAPVDLSNPNSSPTASSSRTSQQLPPPRKASP